MQRISPESPPLGLIGIGLLGSVLAERLLVGGFAVTGFDVDPARLEAFPRLGGDPTNAVGEVFARSSRVVLSLPSHREGAALLRENAAAPRPGTTIIYTLRETYRIGQN